MLITARRARFVAIGLVLGTLGMTLAACSATVFEPLVAPSRPSPPVPPPARTGAFPSVSGSVFDRVTYSFIAASSSRYVFHDDTTFALQYVTPTFGFFEYKGQYSRADSVLTFDFDGWSVLGPWRAQGTLRGDTLIVRYNEVMILNDFEDGQYVRASSSAR